MEFHAGHCQSLWRGSSLASRQKGQQLPPRTHLDATVWVMVPPVRTGRPYGTPGLAQGEEPVYPAGNQEEVKSCAAYPVARGAQNTAAERRVS